MPRYKWLIKNDLDTGYTAVKIRAMRKLGVPYPKRYEDSEAMQDLQAQAKEISDGLAAARVDVAPEKEIVALIAYLQRLGTDIKGEAQAGGTP